MHAHVLEKQLLKFEASYCLSCGEETNQELVINTKKMQKFYVVLYFSGEIKPKKFTKT